MNNRIAILLLEVFIIPVSLLSAQEYKRLYRTTDFYTNRSLKTDTLFLPVDTPCELHIRVRRLIKDIQSVSKSQYWQDVHSIRGNQFMLSEDRVDFENCCWTPTYYRIFPEITYVFFINRKRKSAIDADDYITQNKIRNYSLSYWKADRETTIGNTVANFMPFIEMFLWQKINNEITLICDKSMVFIQENIIIQVMPSENICLPNTTPTKSVFK